jgi:AcrR family transcriptional regulator
MGEAQETELLVGRELLLDVACRLFMEHGFDGVSMQQIATAAHMTKGSPYYHFKGKEDLFTCALVARVDQVNAGFVRSLALPGTLRGRLVTAFTHILATTDPGMIRMLEDFQRLMGAECTIDRPGFEPTPEVMRRAYLEVFATADIPLRLPAGAVADALIAMQLGTLHMQVLQPSRRREPLSENEIGVIAETTTDLFLEGALLRGG